MGRIHCGEVRRRQQCERLEFPQLVRVQEGRCPAEKEMEIRLVFSPVRVWLEGLVFYITEGAERGLKHRGI